MPKEYGRIGQRRYGGVFYEEFLKELQGKRGVEVYREMSENDDMVGAILFAVEMLIRQASWRVEPASGEPADADAAEFVESCLYDMTDTWTDTISEILSFITFGWSYHEIVYKRRMGQRRDAALSSKHDDGLIGWQKLPIRAQETLFQWEYDSADNLLGMTQIAPPDYKQATIPIEKAILFRTKSRKNNPEGRSVLRNAYRAWYFKKRIQEIEGIGIERDLAGLPVLTAPDTVDLWADAPDMRTLRAASEALVSNIRRDAMEGIVLPGAPQLGQGGWKLELLSTGGRRQFDTGAIIERYDTRIAMCTLADFILLGHQAVGSFALSSDKTELFATAIGAYLDIICEAFNRQAIPRLIDLNAERFGGLTDYPALRHGDIEKQELGPLGDFLQKMTASGIILPDETLEDFVREEAGLPERMEDALFDSDARNAQRQAQRTKPANPPTDDASTPTDDVPSKPTDDELEPDDPEAVEAARKRLNGGAE